MIYNAIHSPFSEAPLLICLFLVFGIERYGWVSSYDRVRW